MFVANMNDNNGMSHRFAEVDSMTIFKGRLVQQITMNMKHLKKNYNRVTTRVRLDGRGMFQDLIHWDVDIHGANIRERTNEITLNF